MHYFFKWIGDAPVHDITEGELMETNPETDVFEIG